MITRNKKSDKLVRKLRRVLDKVHPDELKLSPITVMEIMEEAEDREIDVVELEMEDDGEVTKHICFKGVPIILCVKLSHHQRKLAYA
ncbi:MAG: hypothetical protein JXA22_08575 [Candidatus Thermoplasmatota archaeon]|nr:hypothetical protein [Candidatus Thermoplasmatota archaeon]